MQEAISDNGGEYRGDLTKEVTHLIAYAPEGKKYQYATQWEVKVVGLKWLEDSLARRMILEEALYHPNIPQDEQGAGAWKRQPRPDVQLGKRTRADEDVPDVPRKLRRTASMKLGSQRETLWCEIVNGPPGEDSANDDQLRPSKSLPILNSVALEPKSFTTDTTGTEDDRRRVVTTNSNMTEPQQGGNGIFAHLGFYLYAFTSKQVRASSSLHTPKQNPRMRGVPLTAFQRRRFCKSTYSAMTASYFKLYQVRIKPRLPTLVDCSSLFPTATRFLIYRPWSILIGHQR